MLKRVCIFVFGLAAATIAEAGNSTLTYSSAQSTQIQTRLIPNYNRNHCLQFGLSATCNTAQLSAAGRCSVTVFKTLTLDSCVIFTQDAAGEQAFLQEQSNQHLVQVFNSRAADDQRDFCNSFNAASGATQNSVCTSLGLGAGCSPCSIGQ